MSQSSSDRARAGIRASSLKHSARLHLSVGSSFCLQESSVLFRFCMCEFAYLLKFIVTPKSFITVLLWSPTDRCRPVENLSHLMCVFPAEV